MTSRGRRTGPVLKGICPVCGELRHLRIGGVLGQHKTIYRNHYRGGPCPGVDQPAVIYGPQTWSQNEKSPSSQPSSGTNRPEIYQPGERPVKPMSKITLAPNGGSRIVIDGVDIANRVTKITIEADHDHTEATVRFGRIADTEVHAHTIVDNATRAALLKLGWTPPGEAIAPTLPAPEHLGLGELITRLETEHKTHPGKRIRTGFGNPHSDRGFYEDLAFDIAQDVAVEDMLNDAKKALDETYQGWKGGDYTMTEYTRVWLVPQPGACGESLGAVLLELMLAQEVTA